MRKILLVCFGLLLLSGCKKLEEQKIEGVYILHTEGESKNTYYLEVGESMATYGLYGTEMSSEYKIENGYLYLTAMQMPIRFQIDGSNTLILENKNLLYPSGKYIKVKGL